MPNYLYLDDERVAEVNVFIRRVKNADSNLQINLASPKELQAQMQKFQEGGFDGVILDLRLSENVPPNEERKAGYNAPTLAQEIRNRAAEGLLPSFPVVLWSTDDKMKLSYWKDHTSHDLFDLKVLKGKITHGGKVGALTYAQNLAKQLLALVDGYQKISTLAHSSQERAQNLLGISEHNGLLDPRISAFLEKGINDKPIYEQARFILRQLLEIPNSALVSKNILAARLGLSLEDSPDFDALIEKLFPNTNYKGPFSDAWSCWWFQLIERIWEALPDNPGPLRSLQAEERVRFLKDYSALHGLAVAQPLELATYTSYWTVCQVTLRPLDTRDGFIVDRHSPMPWQENLYVSLYAIMEGKAAEKHIEISPLEQSRLHKAKKRLLNNG